MVDVGIIMSQYKSVRNGVKRIIHEEFCKASRGEKNLLNCTVERNANGTANQVYYLSEKNIYEIKKKSGFFKLPFQRKSPKNQEKEINSFKSLIDEYQDELKTGLSFGYIPNYLRKDGDE